MPVYALTKTFGTPHAYGAAHPSTHRHSAWSAPFPHPVRRVHHGLVRHFNLSVGPGLGKAHDMVDEGVGPRFLKGKLHETSLRGKHGEGLGSPPPRLMALPPSMSVYPPSSQTVSNCPPTMWKDMGVFGPDPSARTHALANLHFEGVRVVLEGRPLNACRSGIIEAIFVALAVPPLSPRYSSVATIAYS